MLLKLYAYVMTLTSTEEGQGMAEYGLILALVAVMLIIAFQTLQGGIEGVLNSVVAGFN